MTWFKVDDGFWAHPKCVATPPTALALWVRAGSWSAQQLTDGFIPSIVLPMLQAKPKDAAALVDAGLWLTEDGGWRFHDWDAYQPTREQVNERRKKTAERVKAWRDKTSSNGVTADVTNDVSNAPPVPTRPDPSRSYSPSVSPSPSVTRAKNGGDGSTTTPNGTDGHPRHAHHSNAEAACRRYAEERRLPVDADELLAWAYRLGHGDPWQGQRLVNEASEQTLEGMTSPARALRARLRAKVTQQPKDDSNVIAMASTFREIS